MEALAEFQAGLDEVRLLIEIGMDDNLMPAHEDIETTDSRESNETHTSAVASSVLLPDRKTATNFRSAVSRGGVVLLVSHFEAYLKGIAEEYVDRISTGQIPAHRVPVGVREIHFFPRLEEIMTTNDDKQKYRLLEKLSEYNCFWVKGSKPPGHLFKAEKLSRTVTSAKPNVVDELFVCMGYSSKVCDGDLDVQRGDSRMPVKIRTKMEEIVKCRNDIAHGGSDRKVTDRDVLSYCEFLGEFAWRLDVRAEEVIAQITGF